MPFDKLKKYYVFVLFPLFLHDSPSNQGGAYSNKYCYGRNFTQEINIIEKCLLLKLREGQK